MAETLKFGPEWLRALSDGNSVTSPPPSPGFPKYKLAEFRYGREEMLALCHPNKHIPEDILAVPIISIEKPQEPMAYIPLTEEEQRMMSQSVNSPAVLRMMGRGSSGAGGGGNGAPARGGGRGTISERGRGRGRGRGDPYARPGEVDPNDAGFGRGRAYVRSESWEEGRADKRFERGGYTSARVGEPEADPTSPRREYSRSMSDNWRSSKQLEDKQRTSSTSNTSLGGGDGGGGGNEDDGGDWRRATSKHDKWANRNWRDRTRNNSDDRFHTVPEEQRSYRRQRSSSSYDDDLDPDGLPEWSTMDTDDMDCVGTFDSSGAFMSMKDAMALKLEEEREERWRKDSRSSTASNEEKHSDNSTNGAINKSDTERIPDDRPSSDKPSARDNESPEAPDSVQVKQKAEKSQKRSKQKEETVNSNNHSVKRSSPVENQDSKSVEKTPEPDPRNQEQHPPVQNGSAESPAPPPELEQMRLEGKDHIMAALGMQVPQRMTPAQVRAAQEQGHMMHGQPPMSEHKRPEDEISFDHLETAAEEMVANWTAEEDAKSDGKHKVESGSLPWEHEDAKKWFYRDPQGELQGPFNSNEMAEWFSAGYFTMNLLVKRGCDDRFQPLGEIIKRWGRVPFLPGPSPPPLIHTPVSQPGQAVVATVANEQPQPQPQQVQNPQGMDMKMLQQQLLLQQQLFQQQLYLRQLALLQQVQQNERCSKLPPEQQQQLVLQLLMKQQQQMAAQQQQQVQQPPGQLPQQQQPQKISPRSTPDQQQQQQQVNAQNFQNNPAELAAMMNQSLQAQSANPQTPQQPVPGAWMQQASVWDLPGDSAAKQQAMEEFARMEKDHKVNEQRDAEMRAQKQKEEEEEKQRQQQQQQEQEMLRQQEEMKRQEEMRRQQEEMQRQEEMRRQQQEMERQRQLELQQEEEARRRREDEERRRQEEEMRQRQEMEQRQREIEQQQIERQREMERQMKEAQRQKEEMERRNQDEMQRRKDLELEVQRQQEIQRRQEMQRQQEIHHQHQEALRRLQQQQLAQIQLPSTAQWGSQTSSGSQQPTNTMSLAQIQQLQEEKERKEREEQQRLEIQRQQMQVFQQQQQQQQPKKWGSAAQQQIQDMHIPAGCLPEGMVNAAPQHKTLMEIQEEQARQLEKEKMNKQQSKASVPLASAAVWGSTTNSSHWAQEGAWGQAAKQQGLGFWDEAVKTTKNKVASPNPTFPSLNKPTNTANNQIQMSKKSAAKTQREEENIQRLFQERLPTNNDDFTQWCESALRGMGTSVDIPTFVSFLCEVDSPYEVHDYVRSYLGETRDASNFAKMFIEKRSKSRNHHKPVEDSMWGPAPAVNPNLSRTAGQTSGDFEKVASAASKKSKKKMQKLDNSILGFTVHAAPDRVNVGEIDMCD